MVNRTSLFSRSQAYAWLRAASASDLGLRKQSKGIAFGCVLEQLLYRINMNYLIQIWQLWEIDDVTDWSGKSSLTLSFKADAQHAF